MFGGPSAGKKRKTLTPAKRLYIWEHPKLFGRTCSICHQRITKQSDLQLDHTRAFSKGGTKLALAHALCNRMKSSGSLGKIQKSLGIKSKTKKTRRKRRVRRSSNPFGITPIKW
jgi:hypothetical protein